MTKLSILRTIMLGSAAGIFACCLRSQLLGTLGLSDSAFLLSAPNDASSPPCVPGQQATPATSASASGIGNTRPRPEKVYDSSTATVMAMASGYGMHEHRKFVGSLRKTGFSGHIILGVEKDMHPPVKDYLTRQDVTLKPLTVVNCTYDPGPEVQNRGHGKERRTCVHPYPDIKMRWARFPLQRDWLVECDTCTGPAMVIDFRDAYFQGDPFGHGAEKVDGLQVCEEHASQRTTHWLVEWPVRECKNVTFDRTMLCSGSTLGTRDAMIRYLETMYDEMKRWMADPKCHFKINGDDQSIHNYLYYTGKLPFAKAVPNRMGIVNTVGVQGSNIKSAHFKHWKSVINESTAQASERVYDGGDQPTMGKWIGTHFDVTDEEGFFMNFDGARSRVIHQYDRYGLPFHRWLDRQEGKVWE